MTAGDNFQNNERIDSPERATDFATKCSLEAWERGGVHARLGNQQQVDSSKSKEQGFLNFAANDPLLVAQAAVPEATPSIS